MEQRIIQSAFSSTEFGDAAGKIRSELDGKLKRKSKKEKVTKKLVNFDALPEYMKDNEFIRDHYRCEWPLKDVALSLFAVHNETLNIWTHLVGFFLFAWLTAMSLTDETTEQHIVMTFFRRAAVGPLATIMADKSNRSLAVFPSKLVDYLMRMQ